MLCITFMYVILKLRIVLKQGQSNLFQMQIHLLAYQSVDHNGL